MAYSKMKTSMDIEAVDIPTMHKMSAGDYQHYMEGGLFFVDHHGVLRSGPAEYPLAATRQQFKLLIAYLKSLESRVGEDTD